MKKPFIIVLPLVLLLCGCQRQESMNDVADRVFSVAAQQCELMADQLDSLHTPRSFDGTKLIKSRVKWWCSGFFPGTLWLVYENTGDENIRALAERETAKVEPIKWVTTDHDVGFQINCSFGQQYRISGDPHAREVMHTAARSLATRFNPTVGCIRSWDFQLHGSQWQFPVIIDNMMNLELLMSVAARENEPALADVAISHANTTLKNHYRPDYTTYHLVDYNPSDGSVNRKQTVQGYADESAWARGQAWSLYGFTMMYRFTRDTVYLNRAENVAHMLLKRLPEDGIPYWDFDSPKIPDEYRDASAAAVMASAFTELAHYVQDGSAYRRMAERQLRTLSSPEYLAEPGTNGGFILKHSVGNLPGNSEVDVPLTYADYYFLEALGKFRSRRTDINLSPGNRKMVKELLTKLDSTDVYEARVEQRIAALKSRLPGKEPAENYAICMDLGRDYSHHRVDSSLYYFEKAAQIADGMADKERLFNAQMSQANILSNTGFHHEAYDILTSLPRKAMKGPLLVSYYSSWSTLYHGLYSDFNEPSTFREKYREKYNGYRDSLLAVADPSSMVYLRNIEKREARAGNFAEARHYNALRFARIEDPRSAEYATCLYDRFAISYLYERNITENDVEDLLQSAILEVENGNQDIASLLRVEALLIGFNKMDAAKKVSDYYYASLLQFGSRKRLLGGVSQTFKINERNFQSLQRKNRQIKETLVMISLLLAVLVLALVRANRSRLKITRLTENLKRSDDITKKYVGVMFRLYSSYIKRLDVFRTRIHSSLKRGHVEQALEATSPSGETDAEERKELFHNFDTAFVDIFPDYIQTVNACLKPEERIEPKKTEILTTELRILALIKLGIEDSTQIAEMMHCSVKTVYNLRSRLKSRLAISEEEFKQKITEL